MELRGRSEGQVSTMLNRESVLIERLNRLKNTLSAYRGHLTRSYRELKESMSDPNKYGEAITRRDALGSIFESYKEASAKYSECLEQEEDKEAVRKQRESEVLKYTEFMRIYSEWLRNLSLLSIEHNRHAETHHETNNVTEQLGPFDRTMAGASLEPFIEIPLNTDAAFQIPNKQSDLVCNSEQNRGSMRRNDWFCKEGRSVGGKSKTNRDSQTSLKTSVMSRQSQKLAMARWKLAQLEAKQLLLDEQHELETKMREKELKTEMARLQMKKEIIDAQGEVGICALESQYSHVDDDELEKKSLQSLNIETQTLQQKMEKFFSSGFSVDCCNYESEPRKLDEILVNQEPKDVRVKRKAAEDRIAQNLGGNFHEQSELHRILERQTLLMERQQATVERFTTGMELPKREFLYFDGNPVNYTKFMRNFELNVGNKVRETSVKLSFLIQYTTGAAREAIENCVILPADEGYIKAKEILRKNFGQKHTIIRAYIERVTKGPQIKAGEPDKLMQLARDMRNCLLNSTQLNYKADISSMDTLSKIVKKLPLYLQAKWAERSGTLIECDIEPEFQHLTELLEKNASTANTAFGKLVGVKPDDDNKNKFRPRVSNKGTLGATRCIETQTSDTRAPSNEGTIGHEERDSHSVRKQIKCLYCNQTNHDLERCHKFREKSHKERMDFVRKEKLCDNCFRRYHLAKRCRFNAACMLSDCGRKHHSLLHPPSKLGNELSGDPNDPARNEESPHHSNEASSSANCSATANNRQKVSLRVVPVKVKNEDGTREIETYAFIDSGSDTTLCSKDLVQELNLSSKPCEFTLTTVNGRDESRNGQEVKLNIQSVKYGGSIQLDRVWTVESLPISEQCIPTIEDISRWSHLSDLEFPRLKNAKVTILIGSDVPEAHWIFEERRGRPKEPLAARTLLGWTLLGPVGGVSRQEVNANFIHMDQESITSQVQRLYNAEFTETSCSTDMAMSIEDRRALAIIKRHSS